MASCARVMWLVVLGMLSFTVFADPDKIEGEDGDKCEETKVEVTGPLDAVDLEASPPTITVLGITIDISKAEEKDHEEFCECLKPGAWVEVKLFNADEPLQARELKLKNGYEQDPEIKAPIQSFDAEARTITVLGVAIDVSKAKFEGAISDGVCQDADLTELQEGQYVKIELCGCALPELLAKKVEVKNYINELNIEVDCGCKDKNKGDKKGKDDDDDNDRDGEGDDEGDDDDRPEVIYVKVCVYVKVAVEHSKEKKGAALKALAQKGKQPKPSRRMTKKEIVLKAKTSDGKVTLKGVPAGKAKITVSTERDGKAKAKKNVEVKSGTKNSVALKLARR